MSRVNPEVLEYLSLLKLAQVKYPNELLHGDPGACKSELMAESLKKQGLKEVHVEILDKDLE